MSRLALCGISYASTRQISLDGLEAVLDSGVIHALGGAPRRAVGHVLEILAGMRAPTRGTARLGEIDLVRDPDAWAQRTRRVSGAEGLPRRVLVREVLDAERAPSGALKAQLVESLELGPLLSRACETLTPFERARVVFARALVADPELLVIDALGAWRAVAWVELRRRLARVPLDPDAVDQELGWIARASQELTLEWLELAAELARFGKVVVLSTDQALLPLARLPHQTWILEDGRLLEGELARAAAGRLELESFLVVRPRDVRQLGPLGEILAGTLGMRAVRRLGGALVATYAGPFEHARVRLESRATARGVALAHVAHRRVRPSRLWAEP